MSSCTRSSDSAMTTAAPFPRSQPPAVRNTNSSTLSARFGCLEHGLHDVDVAGAHAQLAGQGFADLVLAWLGVVVEELDGAEDHAWRTEAALQRVALLEGALQRVELAVVCQAFYCGDLGAVRLDGQHQAGSHALAIHQDRAGAAHAVLAADVGARQLQVVAQEVGQRAARLDVALVSAAVNGEADDALGQRARPS